VNDAPTATNDTVSMNANTGAVINVVANDSDPEDGPITTVDSVSTANT